MANPYFKGVSSIQPDEGKTAAAFHAKDDLPEVRREVFSLLVRHELRFYAVVRDKRQVLAYVRQQNERDAAYRYNENELYDSLVRHLFKHRFARADHFRIWFARRGRSDRNRALRSAIEQARGDFERDSDRRLAACGQAVLWSYDSGKMRTPTTHARLITLPMNEGHGAHETSPVAPNPLLARTPPQGDAGLHTQTRRLW